MHFLLFLQEISNYDFILNLSSSSSYIILASIRLREDVLKTTWTPLEDEIFEDEKLLCFIITKTDNCFAISLDFDYVLHQL